MGERAALPCERILGGGSKTAFLGTDAYQVAGLLCHAGGECRSGILCVETAS